MGEFDTDRRTSRRNSVSLEAVVKGRESDADFWKENTEIVTVSRLGASFNLSRECQVGRILSLIVKMPKKLRCYDRNTKLYRVWGLVQHCSALSEENDYQIGIAFIGKFAPESYLENPLRTYRIVGMDEDGFWNVGETKAPFVSRAYHRFPSVLAVRIATLDDGNTESRVDHDAVTENISEGGASVFSNLEVESGDAVNFKCELNGFSSLAVVRNRQTREGGRATIHIEFSRLFPIKDIDLSFEDEESMEPADGFDQNLESQSDERETATEIDLETSDSQTPAEESEDNGFEDADSGYEGDGAFSDEAEEYNEIEIPDNDPEADSDEVTAEYGEIEFPAENRETESTEDLDESEGESDTEADEDGIQADESDYDFGDASGKSEEE